MSANSLPTKAHFFANHLEKLEACGICHELFDTTHVAMHIQGRKCQHIFGESCLYEWLNSNAEQSNTYPMCREKLFVKPPPPVKRCICTITNTEHAWEYVYLLRQHCRVWQANTMFPDMTLIDKVDVILFVSPLYTAQAYPADFPGGLKLTDEHAELVRPLVEAIFLMPREGPSRQGPSRQATEAEMRDRNPESSNMAWFSLLSRVFDWDFSGTSDN
jgi:hypothetical protein